MSFKVGRSNVFKSILISKGYKQVEIGETADIAYDLHPQNSKISNISSRNLNYITTKIKSYTLLKKNGYFKRYGNENIPDTYLNTNIPDDINGIWFVKKSIGSRGEKVWCFNDRDEIIKFANTLTPNTYIIQKGVENLELLEGHKYTLRVYLLHLRDGRVFIYNDIVGIKHNTPYSENASHDIHVNHVSSERFNFTELHPESPEILQRIVRCSARIFNCLRKEVNFEKAQYHLYGLDFLVDRDHTPWFIEINSFPNLHSKRQDDREDIILNMFNDLYDLVISPKLKGTPEKTGKFIQCLH